ncbi:MAG: prepilin peptidase [Cognatishimia sp.]|uniref:prepilin peptidase n=1 Tax=Cognatishimia sp. TaxID=2211648 RepID=UPI004058C807
MSLTASAAIWFLPFVTPICFYVAYTDMKSMKITNQAVLALFGVFAFIGLIALPFEDYLWRYVHVIVALLAGMALNAVNAMGAGDAKFIAAAAPFVALADIPEILVLFAGVLLVAFCAHRLVKRSPLRQLAPDWESWHLSRDFPMGLALGPTLVAYLGMSL